MKPEDTQAKVTTLDEIIERLKELPKSTRVVSFELKYKDSGNFPYKIEYK